jgi:hypothetical protein
MIIVLPNFLGNIMPKYLGRQINRKNFLGIEKQVVSVLGVKYGPNWR